MYKSLLPYYIKQYTIICSLDEEPLSFISASNNECCPVIQNAQLLLNEIPDSLNDLCIGVYPDNSLYNGSRFIYNKLWNYFPHAIYYPTKVNDISYLIKQFVTYNADFSIRCGGHSYEPAALSLGYIIDVTGLPSYIKISKNRKHATISSGFRLGELATELAKDNLIIVAGENSCVGISGISLMGGKSVLSRMHGTLSDNIVAVKMVNYKGEIITANKNTNADLFWAIKGAGNGNFGVITEFTINVYENIYFYQNAYTWQWNKDQALIILQVYQEWALHIPNIIFSKLYIGYNGSENVTINLTIIKYGKVPLTEDKIFTTLFQPVITKTDGYYVENLNNFVYGCGALNQPLSKIKSTMIFEPIQTEGLLLLIDSVEAQIKNGYNIVYDLSFSQMGGEVENGNSAYYPKDATFVLTYFMEWTNPTQSKYFIDFLNELYIKTEPYTSFYCFANMIDYDIVDYLTKYYGNNKARLIKIKTKYDPDNIFKSKQGIPVITN